MTQDQEELAWLDQMISETINTEATDAGRLDRLEEMLGNVLVRLEQAEHKIGLLSEIIHSVGDTLDVMSGSIAILGGLSRDPEEGQGVKP